MKCIQCGSKWCGAAVCRFSGIRNVEYLRVQRVINSYANAMTDRDQAASHEGRPDHDMRCDGMPLKAGT